MRVAVCDDVPVYVEQLKKYIERWSAGSGFHIQLLTFENGEEVLFDHEVEGDFFAVFLDIQLYGMDGMETAKKIREQNPQVSIVFVTKYREYSDEMSRLYPFQYLKKPVSKQVVFQALDNILKEQKISYESFYFRYNRRNYSITLWQVLYFISDKRKIRIMLEDGRELVFYKKLNTLEKELSSYNQHFLRIHQSYLVNERQIEEYCSNQVKLRNGEVLPISRRRKKSVRQFCMGL